MNQAMPSSLPIQMMMPLQSDLNQGMSGHIDTCAPQSFLGDNGNMNGPSYFVPSQVQDMSADTSNLLHCITPLMSLQARNAYAEPLAHMMPAMASPIGVDQFGRPAGQLGWLQELGSFSKAAAAVPATVQGVNPLMAASQDMPSFNLPFSMGGYAPQQQMPLPAMKQEAPHFQDQAVIHDILMAHQAVNRKRSRCPDADQQSVALERSVPLTQPKRRRACYSAVARPKENTFGEQQQVRFFNGGVEVDGNGRYFAPGSTAATAISLFD
jgi:hypothetical protein